MLWLSLIFCFPRMWLYSTDRRLTVFFLNICYSGKAIFSVVWALTFHCRHAMKSQQISLTQFVLCRLIIDIFALPFLWALKPIHFYGHVCSSGSISVGDRRWKRNNMRMVAKNNDSLYAAQITTQPWKGSCHFFDKLILLYTNKYPAFHMCGPFSVLNAGCIFCRADIFFCILRLVL